MKMKTDNGKSADDSVQGEKPICSCGGGDNNGHAWNCPWQESDEQESSLKQDAELEAKSSPLEKSEDAQTISVPIRLIPENTRLVEAYETISQVIVMFGPGEEISEDHNCDQMGCGSFSHVKYKLRKP